MQAIHERLVMTDIRKVWFLYLERLWPFGPPYCNIWSRRSVYLR